MLERSHMTERQEAAKMMIMNLNLMTSSETISRSLHTHFHALGGREAVCIFQSLNL